MDSAKTYLSQCNLVEEDKCHVEHDIHCKSRELSSTRDVAVAPSFGSRRRGFPGPATLRFRTRSHVLTSRMLGDTEVRRVEVSKQG